MVQDYYVIDVAETEALEELLRNAPLPMIASRIKRARRTAGWSHDRLGEEMGGVFRQTLIGYEKAKHRPKLPMILKLADATSRDPRWFVDPDVDPSPFQGDEKAA